jgi:hypothetical protein
MPLITSFSEFSEFVLSSEPSAKIDNPLNTIFNIPMEQNNKYNPSAQSLTEVMGVECSVEIYDSKEDSLIETSEFDALIGDFVYSLIIVDDSGNGKLIVTPK